MGIMRKQMLAQQRASFEQTLRERMSYLSGKGIPPSKADRDTIVRKLKADIRAVNNRLKTIADNDKRTEEMARIKAERAALPKDREVGKSDKPKKAADEGKGKKTKTEGGKGPKAAEPPGKGPAATKKNAGETSEGPGA